MGSRNGFSACHTMNMNTPQVVITAETFEPVSQPITLTPGTVVATQQPIYNLNQIGTGDSSLKVGWKPMQVRCPSCQGEVQTSLITSSTTTTHLCALILYICCLWPCVVLPYCFNYCKNVRHFCPNCGNHIGTYSI
ncbi:lipopolysaccharide-induced tumor necrosis factor-alpha factor homolog [Drosophila pseudoobscura]|uniref:Lipopolysaccharide-induced tumor necrosis factor-alpha factor homolog n=1 Tax=Drosophila pseudoobscura pseudoobscura TaxID=46245 RepID=A0A6I8UT37_DROPS|nr:lipopolysaccharide-induced tumor necrosis factor-alpha factor homolog [Drosophila pseudoobscura]